MQPHVFIFTGFSGKLMGYPEKILRKIFEAQGYFVHTFTDSDFDMYITGGDQFETGAEMRNYLREYVGTGAECLALASSGGGFGGIMHGNAAGLTCIVGYSVFTTIDLEARNHDKRGKSILGRLDQLIEDDRERNLLHHLGKDGLRSSIHLYFAGKNKNDHYQANNLRGVETVALHRVPAQKHTMFDSKKTPFDMLSAVAETERLHFRWPVPE